MVVITSACLRAVAVPQIPGFGVIPGMAPVLRLLELVQMLQSLCAMNSVQGPQAGLIVSKGKYAKSVNTLILVSS